MPARRPLSPFSASPRRFGARALELEALGPPLLRLPLILAFEVVGAILFAFVPGCAAADPAITATAARPATEALPAPIAQALNDAGIPLSTVGLVVQAVGTEQARLELNATLPLNPASAMKLVSTYAALHLLGPAWRWNTQLLSTRNPQDGILEGDVFVRGAGDPKLTADALREALRTLRARGVRDIRGDLVLDRSLFETDDIDPGHFDQEPTRPYNVGPDPLLMQFKAIRFQFIPDTERGTITVAADPALPQIETQAAVRSTAGPCPDWRSQLRLDVQGTARSARVGFSGSMPASCGERNWYLGLLSHPEFFNALFRALWTELGGTLSGGLREARVPADARVLASIESPALAEVVRDINKYSNNVMARQLFLNLSAPVDGATAGASLAGSARRVEALLRSRSIDSQGLVLDNGSGLSRSERISAATLTRILLDAWSSNVMPEFISSMPIAAVDGTLRTRAGLRSMAGDAHIKTGSLAEVRSIAGFVQTPKGERYAVVMIVNSPNAARVTAAQDALLRWVHGLGASATTAPRESSAVRQSTRKAAPVHR